MIFSTFNGSEIDFKLKHPLKVEAFTSKIGFGLIFDFSSVFVLDFDSGIGFNGTCSSDIQSSNAETSMCSTLSGMKIFLSS